MFIKNGGPQLGRTVHEFCVFSGFPPSTKTNTAKFHFDREQWTKRHALEVPLRIPIYFYYFIIFFLKIRLEFTDQLKLVYPNT